MITRTPKWAITITHKPTGISVTRHSHQFRHQYQARDSAMRYLKSRLYMLGYGGTIEEEITVEEGR